jgi:hypothetical protein
MRSYNFSKKIFVPALIICLLLFFYVIATNGVDILKGYTVISCPNDTINPHTCNNPLYDEYGLFKDCVGDYCDQKILFPGQTIILGVQPTRTTAIFNYGVFIVLVVAIMINHWSNNRKV